MSTPIINKTTFAHIARLVWNASGRLLKVIIGSDFDIYKLRDAVIMLAQEIERNVHRAVEETKRILYENEFIRLTTKETNILRQAIVTISTTVSLLIYNMIHYLKRLLSSFIDTMGMADIINGVLSMKTIEYRPDENLAPSPENETVDKQNQDE